MAVLGAGLFVFRVAVQLAYAPVLIFPGVTRYAWPFTDLGDGRDVCTFGAIMLNLLGLPVVEAEKRTQCGRENTETSSSLHPLSQYLQGVRRAPFVFLEKERMGTSEGSERKKLCGTLVCQ